MLNVSDDYKKAVADSHRKSRIRAELKVGSKTINLDDNDIIKDTLYVSNQCVNGNDFEYGCVFSAECGMTIKSDINRYNLYGSELKVYWSLLVGSDWEEIPLGIFYVSEANRINDKVSLKALDRMTFLDVNVEDDTHGTTTQLLKYIAEKCGITLAQTDDELKELANSDILWSVYADKVETHRDLLSFICMMSACFATFERYGKLKLVKYGTEPVMYLDKKQRFQNASFSDYLTTFKGLKARFIAEENYAPYGVEVKTGDGLVLDMGDIPIVRGLPVNKYEWLMNVCEVLKNVEYIPCEIETIGNPAIELGDMIANTNVGKENKTYKSLVMSYTWSYRGKHKIRSFGGNPLLNNIKDKSNKQMSSLEGSISTKDVIVKNYTNADKLTFSANETDIALLNYAATEEKKILFLMTVRVNASDDGMLVLNTYIDSVLDENRIYKQYVERGDHVISLCDIFVANTNDRRNVVIKAHMEYFESDNRRQEADRRTFNNFLQALKDSESTVSGNVVQFPSYDVAEINNTIPTGTIEKYGVQAILYGQGIAGDGKWDGTINISQNIDKPFVFGGNLTFNTMLDNLSVGFQNPIGGSFSEHLSAVFSGEMMFRNVSEHILFGEKIVDYVFNTTKADLYDMDKYINTTNGMFSLKSIYTFDSKEETIDVGKMCSVAIDYSGIDVESVVVTDEL